MTHWVRFEHNGETGFGTVTGDAVAVYRGDMFGSREATGEIRSLSGVRLLTPVPPAIIIALYNNFRERAAKEGLAPPQEPLYFIKPPSCFLANGETIRRPRSFDRGIVFEAELGVVIGRECREISEADADQYIFGYTCVNDVTAGRIIKEDPVFEQWTRSKGFDTFGAVGPHIVSGINPDKARVRAVHNGKEEQNYPVSDMFFSPRQLVSRISHFQTLMPGDLIACGTSLGARPLKDGDQIDVVIDGIGTLNNRFSDNPAD